LPAERPAEAHDRLGSVIVVTTFVTLAVIYGVWYSYSVFLVALVREFGWSRSLVSGAFSFFVLVNGGLGPVVGWMARRFGPRRLFLIGGMVMGAGLALTAETRQAWHLYLAFGGITSLGISLAGWVPAVVLVQGWFPRRFGTAMGIASAGIGAGILGVTPLAQLVIDRWGWQWAFRMEAALTVGWMLPASCWLIRNPPDLTGSGPSARESPATEAWASWTIAGAIRTWRFWGVAGVFFTANFVTQMLLIHQVAYLVDHAVPPMVAATVGGMVGLVAIGAKIGWGVLSDRIGRETTTTLAFGCVLASIGALVLAGRHPASALPFVYAVLIALGYGVLSPVFPAVASDLFAGPGFSTIYGALYGAICLGLAAGAWSAGRLFDATGSYAVALWVGAGMTLLTPTLLWLAAPRRPNPAPRP
jgi:MFS transporter, OFA family, oxalate/formate antiporter